MGRQKGCKSTKAEVRGTKSKPQRKSADTRTRLKEIVCYIMFEDEVNVTDSYSILDDPLAVDKWLDPVEIAVMAEKEFGLPESEWPDEVFQSFGKLFTHLQSLCYLAVKHPALAQNGDLSDREAHGRL